MTTAAATNADKAKPSMFRRAASICTAGWGYVRLGWDYVPLTLLGLVLGGLAVWGFFGFSEDSADHIVYALSAVAMAIVGMSVVSTGLFAFVLWHRVRRAPVGVSETLMAGRSLKTSFRAPGFRFWPMVQVSMGWVDPADVDVETAYVGTQISERVTAHSRGRYEGLTRRFAIRDVFGLAEIAFCRRWEQPLTVLPGVGRADVSLEVRRATADGYSHPSGRPVGEMVEMRRYAHGDSMRHVIWKVFARNRRLMVREPEKAIAPRPAMVAFFVAADRDEPSASTAQLFLEKGLFGNDFLFLAEGGQRATPDTREALSQIIGSRAHRDTQANALAGLFRSVDRSRLDNLVIFAPATPGRWIDIVLTVTRGLPLPPMVILTVDGTLEGKRRGRLSRFFFADPPAESGGASDMTLLPELYERLRGAGLDLRVVHRPSGRRIEAAQMQSIAEAVR
ncbi:MAG: hypothetical protein ACI9MR_001429 [Myxococcota bacterium]|jgi:hypothetical protein